MNYLKHFLSNNVLTRQSRLSHNSSISQMNVSNFISTCTALLTTAGIISWLSLKKREEIPTEKQIIEQDDVQELSKFKGEVYKYIHSNSIDEKEQARLFRIANEEMDEIRENLRKDNNNTHLNDMMNGYKAMYFALSRYYRSKVPCKTDKYIRIYDVDECNTSRNSLYVIKTSPNT